MDATIRVSEQAVVGGMRQVAIVCGCGFTTRLASDAEQDILLGVLVPTVIGCHFDEEHDGEGSVVADMVPAAA